MYWYLTYLINTTVWVSCLLHIRVFKFVCFIVGRIACLSISLNLCLLYCRSVLLLVCLLVLVSLLPPLLLFVLLSVCNVVCVNYNDLCVAVCVVCAVGVVCVVVWFINTYATRFRRIADERLTIGDKSFTVSPTLLSSDFCNNRTDFLLIKKESINQQNNVLRSMKTRVKD